MTVTERYREALQKRGYQTDPAQLAAVARLQRLADELEHFRVVRANVVKRAYREIGIGIVTGVPSDRDSGATYTADFGVIRR